MKKTERRQNLHPGLRRVGFHSLDRVLSKLGVASRSVARKMIREGRVEVDGKMVRNPEYWVDVARSRILVDGRQVTRAPRIYLMLNKPAGYVTTYRDLLGRSTVYDLLHGVKQWVFPVGRLDLDSSGLLLLTNDTQLAERVTNPVYHVPKTYLVTAKGRLTERQLEQLRQGVPLSDGPTLPAEVKRLRELDDTTVLEITIVEGRNRQVRRMLKAVGSKVRKLTRVRIGPLTLGNLPEGRFRHLSQAEIRALRQQAFRGPGRAPHNLRPRRPGRA